MSIWSNPYNEEERPQNYYYEIRRRIEGKVLLYQFLPTLYFAKISLKVGITTK